MSPVATKQHSSVREKRFLTGGNCGYCRGRVAVDVAVALPVCYGKFNQPRVQGRSNATNELPHTQLDDQRWGRNDGTEVKPLLKLKKNNRYFE